MSGDNRSTGAGSALGTRDAGAALPIVGARRRVRRARGLRGGVFVLAALLSLLLIAPAAHATLPAGLARAAQTLRDILPRSPAALPDAATWNGFSPTGWVTVRPFTSSVTAQAPAGLDPATAAYGISTDAGATWSGWTAAGLTVSGAISTTQTLTVADLNLGDAASTNQIRFRIQETGAALEVSPAYTLSIDTAAPISEVTQPAYGAFLATAPALQGTAADGVSGLAAVSVSIRDAATGLYWTGAAWTGGEQWLAAAGTAAWSYAGPQPAWADAIAYAIRSRASDVAGNQETPGPGVSFTFDATPPTVTVTAPNGGEIWAGGQAHTLTWTAADVVGLAANPIRLSVSYDGGASWSVIADAQPNSGSFSWTPPAMDNNRVLVQVEATDRAGNRGSDRGDAVFTLDSTPPGAPQSLTATPSGWTKVANFTLTWTNPADLAPLAGAWYKLDAPPTGPADGIFRATANTLTGVTPIGDGIHPVYVWLQDQLGRADHTSAAATLLNLDTVAPPPPFGLQGNPARTWTNVNNFSETWSNPSDSSGIVGAYYRLDTEGASPTDGIRVDSTNSLTNIVVPSDGKHDLYIWLVDAAGNFNNLNRNVDTDVFWYDGTPPSSSVSLAPLLPANGWYSTTVTASFAGQDPAGGSGLDAVFSRIDSGEWATAATAGISTEGRHTISYYARDLAGNYEALKEVSLALDLTPPTATLAADRLPLASGWYTAPVNFTFTVADALSGSPQGYYRLNGRAWQIGSQFQITADGTYLVEYFGQDAAGNRTAIGAQQVRLDATPPATAYVIEGSQGQDGWYTSPLTVKLVVNDAASGAAATYYRVNNGAWQTGTQFQLASDGTYTIAFYSVDAAGNVETSYPVQVKLDSAAPGTPTAVETVPSDWSRVNRFTVQWANPTDLSGIVGAYYRLDREPTGANDGILSVSTNRLDGLTVPEEGVHRLYIWLRDGAGNADHRSRALAPLLRYDATAPVTTATVRGLAGTEGWYRGPVSVTLSAVDAHSGIARLRYRLNAGEWISTSAPTVVLAINEPEKHVLEFASEDVAGNAETLQQVTLRLDFTPPAAPQALRAEPEGWQHANSFRLIWRAPLDQSGIAGAYVRLNAPPTGPSDGTFYPAVEVLEGLTVPGEGRYGVYVWLRDRAGNADYRTAVALADALWYDASPPTTVIEQTGVTGLNGWYVGPVSFTMSATDTASGLAEIRHQVDDGPWIVGNAFTLAKDGDHTVRITSVDTAGNVAVPAIRRVAIDQQPPVVRLQALARYQEAPSFAVSWWGDDSVPGSGIASYDVQVRDGYTGAWRDWQIDTLLTEAVFAGERGHTYFFRAAALDRAGNQPAFSDGGTFAAVEAIRNGNFDTGNFTEWTASGMLYKAVVPTTGHDGRQILAARLGTEDYGPSLTDPGQVPVGSATITQTLRVPDAGQFAHPMLTFWYRVQTYDVMYSERLQRYVDTFDVSVYDLAGRPLALLLRDGNPTKEYKVKYDTGWKQASIDLSAFAGQTVQLVFANFNRHDNLFNTWSYLDHVQVRDGAMPYRQYMGWVLGGGEGSSAAAAAETALPERAAGGSLAGEPDEAR